MLSRFVMTIVFAPLAAFPCSLHGQTAAMGETRQQQEKIGKINIQVVISSTQTGKKTLQDLVKQFEPQKKVLAKQNAEIDKLKERLSGKISDREREKLTAAIDDKEKALHSNYDRFSNELLQAENKVLEKIGLKVVGVLANYAKANGYAVILDTSSPQIGILWANEETVRRLGLLGKPQPEIEKGLAAAFADKEAMTIDQELIAACDAEIHSID